MTLNPQMKHNAPEGVVWRSQTIINGLCHNLTKLLTKLFFLKSDMHYSQKVRDIGLSGEFYRKCQKFMPQ